MSGTPYVVTGMPAGPVAYRYIVLCTIAGVSPTEMLMVGGRREAARDWYAMQLCRTLPLLCSLANDRIPYGIHIERTHDPLGDRLVAWTDTNEPADSLRMTLGFMARSFGTRFKRPDIAVTAELVEVPASVRLPSG